MIEMDHVTKRYYLPRGIVRTVLNDISYVFQDGVNTGILGLNGSGKSTLMRILCGRSLPDDGFVRRSGRVSWPVGFSGGISPKLTGRENMRFTCRLYGEDIRQVTHFVESFTELGDYMDLPVSTYSSGMKAKLAFALSMAIEFDYYLIDEGFATGDGAFKLRAKQVFEERRKNATLLIVAHSASVIRRFCDSAVILHNGRFLQFDTLDSAVLRYRELYRGRA